MNNVATRLALCASSAVLLCGCATFDTPGDSWWGPDKAKHFAAGAILGAAGAAVEPEDDEPVLTGVGAAFVVGVGKEGYDYRVQREDFSLKDLVWDLLGGVAGACAVEAAR